MRVRPALQSAAMLLLVVTRFAVLAQNTDIFPEFTHRAWHVQDGLTDQVVQALTQAQNHYLWIGTNKGLVQFDGSDFKSLKHSALGQGVTCLLTASDGSIYIGTPGRGLLRLRDGHAEPYTEQAGLDRVVRAIYQQRNGTIWVGTDTGLFRLQGDHFIRIHLSDGPAANSVSSALAEDGTGAMWSGGTHLFRIRGGVVEEIRLPQENGATRVRSLIRDPDGSVWVGTAAGLFHYDLRTQITKIEEVQGTVRTLFFDDRGILWAGTAGRGLYFHHGSKFVHVSTADGLPGNTVLSQAGDDEGNIWIGTQSGLLRLSRMGMHRSPIPGWTDSDFGAVMRDADGVLWVCSSQLFRMRNGNAEKQVFPAVGGAIVRTMFRDRNGSLWLGTAGSGVFQVKPDGRIVRVAKNVQDLYVRGFLQASDGSIWIRNDGSFGHYLNGKLEQYPSPMPSPSTMAEGTDHRIWIGTEHGLSSIYEGRFLQPEFGHVFEDQSVWSIVPRTNGSLWIGTGSGFYSVDKGQVRRLNLPDSSPSAAVYQILPTANDMVWIAGPTRVYHLSASAIQRAFDTGHQEMPDVEIFAVSAEIQSSEIYVGKEATGVVEPDGSAWFATTQGPVHLVPGEWHRPSTVPLRIDTVMVDGREKPINDGLELPSRTRAFQIHFAPILLSSQTGLVFQYRLAGFDDWSLPSTSRTATYTDIPAGHYRFEVKAMIDGNREIGRVEWGIYQRAVFYRTSAFYVVCAACIGGLVWTMYRLRVRKIRNEYHMITVERSRIARELHDTVIRGCTATFAVLDAAIMTMPCPAPLVDVARQQMSETIKEARGAVWDLRQEIERYKLASNLRKLLDKASEASDANCEFQVIGSEPLMGIGVAHELLMTTREALSNAVAHSEAKRIEVILRCTRAMLSVIVSDDGKGFDERQISVEKETHYGLRGMRERIESLGGHFILITTPGAGTTLQFDIPRSVLHHR